LIENRANSCVGVEVAFTGINARYKMYELSEDAFTTLAPGEAFTSTINIAALHDVGGGEYIVSAIGAIPYASPNTTEIAGSIVYTSNTLTLSITNEEAAVVPRTVPILDKRTVLNGCSGDQDVSQRQALGQCSSVAQIAADAARTGSADKFQEFFKTTDSNARINVAARYSAIAAEASSSTSGATTYYCYDPYSYCSSNTLAYTLPSQNMVANVGRPLFFRSDKLLNRNDIH
jgi:deuterolysin